MKSPNRELTAFDRYVILRDLFQKMLGIPYIWGGSDPEVGLDCSGFVQILLEKINLDPPGDQTAQTLYNYFVGKAGTAEDVLGCGSLVFYGKDKNHITHVAMMTDPDTVIEAGGGGRDCTSVKKARFLGACVRLRDFGHRRDMVAVLKPQF